MRRIVPTQHSIQRRKAIGASGLLLAVVLAAAPAPLVGQSGEDMPTLAVLDLRDGGSVGPDAQDLSSLGTGLAMMLTTEMMRNPRVNMVERDQIRALLDEQKLTLSGMVDESTAIKVGKLVGAQYMLFGTYVDLFSKLRIDVRVVEVETGRVRRAQEVTDQREKLFDSVTTLAQRLFRDLDLTPPSQMPPAPPIPARAALLFSQGVGFEDRGDKARAAEMYNRALQAHPQYDEAKKRLARLENQ